jgi:small multidrug resistance pump
MWDWFDGRTCGKTAGLMNTNNSPRPAGWMKTVLLVAGVYNLVWGTWVILFPMVGFDLAGMPRPNYPQLWQCIGMIVGVYGVGYVIAAYDPYRHWPIVLVGLLGKIFGPIGFGWNVAQGVIPLTAGATILTNDLIWWWPFGVILWRALAAERQSVSRGESA